MNHPEAPQTLNSAVVDSPAPEHKQPSKLIFILGGILILAIGLIAGYYFSQTSKSISSSQITPSPIPSPEASNEMEGWKTYVNEEYGYRFKYREDQLEVIECSNNNMDSIFVSSPVKKREYDVCKIGFAPGIKQLDADFALSKSDYDSHDITTTETNIDSRLYTKYVGIRKDGPRFDGMPTSAVSKFVYIPIKINNKTLLISLEVIDPRGIDFEEGLLDKILSTFEFVE